MKFAFNSGTRYFHAWCFPSEDEVRRSSEKNETSSLRKSKIKIFDQTRKQPLLKSPLKYQEFLEAFVSQSSDGVDKKKRNEKISRLVEGDEEG